MIQAIYLATGRQNGKHNFLEKMQLLRKENRMYESPIEIIVGEMQTEYENGILKAVQKYDIHCNKEELTKALAYDRDQYRKGYEDGKASVPQWVPCSERLPEVGEYVLISFRGNVVEAHLRESEEYFLTHKSGMFIKTDDVVAWMPLPMPYEGGTE